jgi:hypothetical protein
MATAAVSSHMATIACSVDELTMEAASAGSRSGVESRTTCAIQSIAAANIHNMNAQPAKIRKLPAPGDRRRGSGKGK